MKKPTYSDKLKDPRWQKKRLEILERDKWYCQQCCDDKTTLHVHHRRYLPGKEPWDIPNEYLVTLCEECHQYETEEMDSAIHDLTSMIKEKFFAASVRALAEAFHNLQIHYECGVTAEAIKHCFSNKELYLEIEEKYFDSLNVKKSNPNK